MAKYHHPGVYTQEVPNNQPISGVPTHTAVFIGLAADPKAPINQPILIDSWAAYQQTFGGFAWFRYLPLAVYAFFNEGGTRCYVVNAGPDATAGMAAVSTQAKPLVISAAATGTWGNTLSVMIDDDTDDGVTPSPGFLVRVLMPVPKPPKADDGTHPPKPTTAELMLEAYIQMNQIKPQSFPGDETHYYVLETFNGFTKTSLDPPPGDPTADPAMVAKINQTSLFIRVSMNGEAVRPKNGVSPLQNGTDVEWGFAAPALIEEVDKIQNFELLALPDVAAQGEASFQMAAINPWLTKAQLKKNFFVVVDPPFGMSVSEITGYKQGYGGQALNSSYGALYYPWLWVINPTSGAKTLMPPSGPALGRYAATDDAVGVWKAPAGTTDGALKMVTDLQYNVTNSDQDTLNSAGVNAIRRMANYGILIWGARTLSTDPQWVYINVRRLVIFIEQSLEQSLKWVVFEPNTPKLWDSVTRDISNFLNELWREGALYGAKASDAYFVTCDASNNPPEQIENGILTVDIGVAPIRPAEFVILRFSQTTLSTR